MKKVSLTVMAAIASMLAFAQEKSADIDVNLNKDSGGGWGAPWMWVVGAAVFILLLVALMRRNTSRE